MEPSVSVALRRSPPTAPAPRRRPPPAARRLPRRYNAADGRGFATIDDGTLSFLSRQFGVLPVLLLPGERGVAPPPRLPAPSTHLRAHT